MRDLKGWFKMTSPKSSNVYFGFQEIKNENMAKWEADFTPAYKEYRRKWEECPKKLIIPDFPLHMDIELTSNCNLRCPMCARTVRSNKGRWRPLKNLDFSLFKKMIDEGAREGLCAINMNNFGEPLLNPELPKMIRYAKEKGILDVFFHTNGVCLDKETAKVLIESGLDKIIISFDSPYADKYEKIRVGAKFDKVLDNIRRFSNIKKSLNKISPIIRINSIKFPDTKKTEIDDLIKLLSPYADSMGLLEYDDPYKESRADFSPGHVSKFICPQIITRLSVWEDGRIFPCCADYDGELCLGNLNEITLRQAWQSKKLKEIREKHFKGKFFEIAACRKCDFALKGDRQNKQF